MDVSLSVWGIVAVLVVLTWRGMLWALSRLSGWHRLERAYPATAPSDGTRFGFQYVEFRWRMSYNGCATVTSGPTSLRLSLIPGFHWSHPPILIPWEEIHATLGRRLGYRVATLSFKREPAVRVTLSRRTFERVAQASGGQLHASDPDTAPPVRVG